MSDQPSNPQDSSSGSAPRPEPEATPSGAFPPPSSAPQRPAYPGTPPGAESNEALPPPAAPGSGGFAAAPPPAGFPPAPPEGGMPPAAPMYGQPPGAMARPERPKPVDLAVKLMWVGAVLAVLQGLTVLLMRDTVRTAVEDSLRNSNQAVTSSAVDAAVTISVVFGIIFGFISAGLWIFMAWANGRGMSWARIVATVLFGLSLLSFIASFFQAAPALSRVASVVAILVGAGAVFLLWQKESSAYFAAPGRGA